MGVIHRDLKPENLMLDDNNRLKIIDFGTAEVFHRVNKNDEFYQKYKSIREKYADESDDVMAFRDSVQPKKSFVGTVYYVAPEMLEHQDVDKGSDFWALGIIIYKMLTGDYLFNEANEYWIFQRIRECNFTLPEDLPESAKDLICQLLKKESCERLGNGTPDEGRDINGLKNHPFFKDINFASINTLSTPIKLDQSLKVDETNVSETHIFNNNQTDGNDKKIILSGLVKKMKYLFLYNTRQLILYSNGTIEYFDPKNSCIKVKLIREK